MDDERARATGNRRLDRRVVELNLRVLERRPIRVDGGLERRGRGRARLHLLRPRRVPRVASVWYRPACVLRVRCLREIAREVGLDLCERRLERSAIQVKSTCPSATSSPSLKFTEVMAPVICAWTATVDVGFRPCR